MRVGCHPHFRLNRVCQLVRACQTADRTCHHIADATQKNLVLKVITLDDVRKIHFGKQSAQISFPCPLPRFKDGQRHAAPDKVILPCVRLLLAADSVILRERQRPHSDYGTSVSEVRRNIFRQHFRVGAGHIYVYPLLFPKRIENVVECHADVPFCRLAFLDFVSQHIRLSPVCQYPVFYVFG